MWTRQHNILNIGNWLHSSIKVYSSRKKEFYNLWLDVVNFFDFQKWLLWNSWSMLTVMNSLWSYKKEDTGLSWHYIRMYQQFLMYDLILHHLTKM